MLTRGERGQAVVETALVIPLILVGMLALIYAGQAGVAMERAQTAVRYGGLVSQKMSGPSIEAMYQAYGAGLPSPTPYTSPAPCASAAADTAAALDQAQVLPSSAPTSFPPTPPYWQVPSPSAACTIGERQVSDYGLPGVTTDLAEQATISLSAPVPVPPSLAAIMPPIVAHESMVVYLPLSVADLLYCTPGLQTGLLYQYYYQQSIPEGTGAQALPIATALDPMHLLWPSYSAPAAVTWTSSNGQQYQLGAQIGWGAHPATCENY